MDRKMDHELFNFDTPEPTKNDTLEQVKIATSSNTIYVASTPSPASRNTGNAKKLKQTPSTCNKIGKKLSSETDSYGF